MFVHILDDNDDDDDDDDDNDNDVDAKCKRVSLCNILLADIGDVVKTFFNARRRRSAA